MIHDSVILLFVHTYPNISLFFFCFILYRKDWLCLAIKKSNQKESKSKICNIIFRFLYENCSQIY